MTILVDSDVKTINIYIDDASSDQELTFHLPEDANMSILNIEEIKTEEEQ